MRRVGEVICFIDNAQIEGVTFIEVTALVAQIL